MSRADDANVWRVYRWFVLLAAVGLAVLLVVA